MELSLIPTDITNFIKKNNVKCLFCETKKNLLNTYYKQEIINCCPLCNIIINFNKTYTFYAVLCHSKMSQLDIIKTTKKLYEENNIIPLPKEIDANAKYIKLPLYLFAQFENKEYLKNYRVFFTCKAGDIITEEIDDVFDDKPKKKIKRDICEYVGEPYVFTEKEIKKINKELYKIKNNNFKLLLDKEEKFIEKIEFQDNAPFVANLSAFSLHNE